MAKAKLKTAKPKPAARSKKVLKGWYKTEFEGEGVHTFEAGSCWVQPPRIKQTVLGYSDDCELLEIVLPADFETVTLAK